MISCATERDVPPDEWPPLVATLLRLTACVSWCVLVFLPIWEIISSRFGATLSGFFVVNCSAMWSDSPISGLPLGNWRTLQPSSLSRSGCLLSQLRRVRGLGTHAARVSFSVESQNLNLVPRVLWRFLHPPKGPCNEVDKPPSGRAEWQVFRSGRTLRRERWSSANLAPCASVVVVDPWCRTPLISSGLGIYCILSTLSGSSFWQLLVTRWPNWGCRSACPSPCHCFARSHVLCTILEGRRTSSLCHNLLLRVVSCSKSPCRPSSPW